MPKADAQPPVDPTGAARTRERILAAAMEAIARFGWGDVTTRRVAELAAVNPALVHYHFGSMARLRREAVTAALVEEVGGPAAALVDEESVAEGVRACLAAVSTLDPEAPAAVVLSEAMLASARDDELRVLLRDALVEFRALLAQRIASAGGRDPVASATLVAAALDGVVLHRIADPELRGTALSEPLLAALLLPAAS